MRSLFARLIAAHLLVILVTLLTIGFIFYTLFYDYYRSLNEQSVRARSQAAAAVLAGAVDRQAKPADLAALTHIISGMLGGQVYLFDADGKLLAGPEGKRGEMGTITLERVGSQLRVGTRTAALLPLMGGRGRVGVLRVAVPATEIAGTLAGVRVFFVWAALLSIAVALLISLVLARRLSTPLGQMRELARAMESGDFSQRASEVGDDEVAQLARALNSTADALQRTLGELHQEQDRLSAVLSGMAEGVAATSADGRLMLANPQARMLLGLADDAQTLPQPLHNAMRVATGPSAVELEAGGRIVQAHISRLPGKGPWGSVAVLRDVSEARRLEEMRRHFVSDISHELRTPLTSMAGFISALGDGTITEEEERRRYVGIVLKETERLNRLINDLLDLSRIEAGSLEIPREPMGLLPLLRSAAESLSAEAAGREVNVALALPEALPPVLGNRDRLYQVIVNLLANAIRFNRPGGKVTLGAGDCGEVVKVEVADTGVGIPAEELERIWDRFHRVEKSRSRSGGGTGLGLAIAKHIVEALGGEIGVASEAGKGSVFHFTVPVARRAVRRGEAQGKE